MSQNFAEMVEEVKRLPPEDKRQLHDLLAKYLLEERRQEIYANYQDGLHELPALEFTTDTAQLREMLEHD